MLLSNETKIENYFIMDIEKDKEFWSNLRLVMALELFSSQLTFSRVSKQEEERLSQEKSEELSRKNTPEL
jgi:hypothetical protein